MIELAEVCENTAAARRGLIVPAASEIGSPNEPDLLPTTAAELERLELPPRELALDGGFFPIGVAEDLPGPDRVFIAGRQSAGSRRTNRRLARFRVGIEGRISHLKRRYGPFLFGVFEDGFQTDGHLFFPRTASSLCEITPLCVFSPVTNRRHPCRRIGHPAAGGRGFRKGEMRHALNFVELLRLAVTMHARPGMDRRQAGSIAEEQNDIAGRPLIRNRGGIGLRRLRMPFCSGNHAPNSMPRMASSLDSHFPVLCQERDVVRGGQWLILAIAARRVKPAFDVEDEGPQVSLVALGMCATDGTLQLVAGGLIDR